MKKVLIFEDLPFLQRHYAKALDGKVVVVSACSVAQAEEAWRDNRDAALIVMDACLEGEEPDTIALLREIRLEFDGPIVAASSNKYFCDELIAAGCSHKLRCKDEDVLAALVCEILEV